MRQVKEFLYELAPSVFATVFSGYEDLGNGGFVLTDEGVILIDTDVRTVDLIAETLRELTSLPVVFLINTHHAFDHSSANCFFAPQGVSIIGSRRCREAMIEHGEANFHRWSRRVPEVQRLLEERDVSVCPPRVTFEHDMQLHLGGKSLELSYHGHGHSPGDIVIYLPRDRILFAGDLLWFRFFPNVREARVPNQIECIDRILSFPVRYYVPGHGPLTDRIEDVTAMRNFLATLYQQIADMAREGRTLDEIRGIETLLIDAHPGWQGRMYLPLAIETIYHAVRDGEKNSTQSEEVR